MPSLNSFAVPRSATERYIREHGADGADAFASDLLERVIPADIRSQVSAVVMEANRDRVVNFGLAAILIQDAVEYFLKTSEQRGKFGLWKTAGEKCEEEELVPLEQVEICYQAGGLGGDGVSLLPMVSYLNQTFGRVLQQRWREIRAEESPLKQVLLAHEILEMKFGKSLSELPIIGRGFATQAMRMAQFTESFPLILEGLGRYDLLNSTDIVPILRRSSQLPHQLASFLQANTESSLAAQLRTIGSYFSPSLSARDVFELTTSKAGELSVALKKDYLRVWKQHQERPAPKTGDDAKHPNDVKLRDLVTIGCPATLVPNASSEPSPMEAVWYWWSDTIAPEFYQRILPPSKKPQKKI